MASVQRERDNMAKHKKGRKSKSHAGKCKATATLRGGKVRMHAKCPMPKRKR